MPRHIEGDTFISQLNSFDVNTAIFANFVLTVKNSILVLEDLAAFCTKFFLSNFNIFNKEKRKEIVAKCQLCVVRNLRKTGFQGLAND